MYLDKLEEKFAGNRKAIEEAAAQLNSMIGKVSDLGEYVYSVKSVETLLDYLRIDRKSIDLHFDSAKSFEDTLAARGFFGHKIVLGGKWWKSSTGVILSKDSESNIVAFVPAVFGYLMIDPHTGKRVRVNRKRAASISGPAICYQRGLGDSSMTIKQFLGFLLKSVHFTNYVSIAIFCIVSTLLCMLTPIANKILFNEVIPSGIIETILPIAFLLFGAGITSVLFNICRNFLLVRVRDKLNTVAQPALIARMLRLPSSFFKKYSSGELSQRVLSVNSASELLTHQILGSFAGGLFAVMFVFVAYSYAQDMVWVVFLTAFLMLGICVPDIIFTTREFDRKLSHSVTTRDFTFNVLSGVHKIKNNHAEFRVFSQWAKRFSRSEPLTAETPFFVRYKQAFSISVSMLAYFLVYLSAWKTGIALSDYIAFTSAMGSMLTAFSELHRTLSTISKLTPQIKLLAPLLEICPENTSSGHIVTSITGSIDVNHVTFQYNSNSPKILDDVSLHIPSGQNVALVGTSGCGKSTLMRLMLGFEKPSSGSIFYGQYNVGDVNLSTLRQFVGFCPQTIQIFPGSICDNIKLSRPSASMEEVWDAARIACLDEDLQRMPLGMDTVLGEGGSGLSGGQCQRVLIARAVLNKPAVLFLDEATSALDNITQKKVIDNIAGFGCTRISIAHRLSTVMGCDRIIALKEGKIIEDGSPEELMQKKGFFYQLSIRQQ